MLWPRLKKQALLQILLLSFFLPCAQVKAGEWLEWYSFNAQLLRGHNYKLDERQRTILTLEHANSWKYGDLFTFVDVTFPDGPGTTYYGEFSPRFSLSKISGKDFSCGIIQDVLISTMVEKPEHQGPRYLYGGAIDLNLPGFTFFNTNLFVRDNTQLEGNTWQVTLAWRRPFKLGNLDFVTEGFLDTWGAEGSDDASSLLTAPRLLMDVGHIAGLDKDKLWFGVEYSYWHNKFNIDGVTESVPQLQIKANF